MSNIRPKSVYFFYYAALACLAPFMVLYYAELGMSGAQIGVLVTELDPSDPRLAPYRRLATIL